MLQHPEADHQVKRLIGERKLLTAAANDRQAGFVMFCQRGPIGVEPGRQLDVTPDELDHTAPAAAQVEDVGSWIRVAPNELLELLIAGPPPGSHDAVALAVGVLDVER